MKSTGRFSTLARLALLALLFGASTIAVAADSPDEARAKVRKVSGEVLERLYKAQPSARKAIADSKGYATFSKWGLTLGAVGGGIGKGLAVAKPSGKETFMRYVEGSAGFGLGIKKYDLVFVFLTDKARSDFIDKGWEYSGQATAAAKSGSSRQRPSKAPSRCRRASGCSRTPPAAWWPRSASRAPSTTRTGRSTEHLSPASRPVFANFTQPKEQQANEQDCKTGFDCRDDRQPGIRANGAGGALKRLRQQPPRRADPGRGHGGNESAAGRDQGGQARGWSTADAADGRRGREVLAGLSTPIRKRSPASTSVGSKTSTAYAKAWNAGPIDDATAEPLAKAALAIEKDEVAQMEKTSTRPGRPSARARRLATCRSNPRFVLSCVSNRLPKFRWPSNRSTGGSKKKPGLGRVFFTLKSHQDQKLARTPTLQVLMVSLMSTPPKEMELRGV